MQSNRAPHNAAGNGQKDLAALIDTIRLPSFSGMLERFLASQCHFDTMLIVTFKKSLKPVILHPTDPSEQSLTLHHYLNRAYILDPLFNVIKNGQLKEGVSRLSDIAPDSFETTKYYQSCYKEFDLIDEINMVIELSPKVSCAISLGRRTNRGTITRAELTRLNNLYPVIKSIIRQFWLSQSQEFVQYEKSEGPMNQAISTFGSGVLTPREQQIVGLILQGHSSKAIATRLNISLGTVKVHRKNIHTRLNTSTQSDIFTLFLAHLKQLDPNTST